MGGLCGGGEPTNPEQLEANKEAERIIKEGKEQLSREVKLLLLGKIKKKIIHQK